MLDLTEKVVYKAFGLNVISDIPLPELPVIVNDGEQHIDIHIEIDDLSNVWSKLFTPDHSFVIKENLVMFQVPNTAIYSIQEGNKIVISPMRDADEDRVRLYIFGACISALLMQRRIFPLHGSAVAIHGKAYAIIGFSGAGKSTLASAFLNKGFQLLSDDVAITFSQDEKKPYVTPSYPGQRLWQDSIKHLGMEAETLSIDIW